MSHFNLRKKPSERKYREKQKWMQNHSLPYHITQLIHCKKKKAWHTQLQGENGLFGSQEKRFQSMISWLYGRNIMAEGCAGAKVLISKCSRSRAQGKNASRKYNLQMTSPVAHLQSNWTPSPSNSTFSYEHQWIGPWHNHLSSSLITQSSLIVQFNLD